MDHPEPIIVQKFSSKGSKSIEKEARYESGVETKGTPQHKTYIKVLEVT